MPTFWMKKNAVHWMPFLSKVYNFCTKKICTIHKSLIKQNNLVINNRYHNPRVVGSNPTLATTQNP